MKLYLEKTAYACRKLGLWDELIAAMDMHEGRVALLMYWSSDARAALTGQMPPEWKDLADEELERRLGR